MSIRMLILTYPVQLFPREDHLLFGAQDQRLSAEQDQLPLWVHRNLFWQLARDRNLHGSGMPHAMTASPKTSFRAPCRVGNTVVGTENAGWMTSQNEHSCMCQSCSHGPPAEKTGRGSLLNCPSCPPNDPIGQGTKQNGITVRQPNI